MLLVIKVNVKQTNVAMKRGCIIVLVSVLLLNLMLDDVIGVDNSTSHRSLKVEKPNGYLLGLKVVQYDHTRPQI